VVLADHSKLGARPFPYWAPLDRAYTLVVDEQADPATVAPFRSDGTVLVAEPAEVGQLTRFPAEAIGESGIAFGAPPVVARAHHGSMSREQAVR
jgi:hypothetical protein